MQNQQAALGFGSLIFQIKKRQQFLYFAALF